MKNNDIAINIGRRIIAIRKQMRLPQKEMATNLNIAASYLCEIENGRAKPNVDLLVKMVSLYNINLNYLLMGTGNMYMENIVPRAEITTEGFNIDEGIASIEELLWLMKNSKYFHSTILSLANKTIITEREVIKNSLPKSPTDRQKKKT